MNYKTEWMIDVTHMNRIVSEMLMQNKITHIIDVKEEDLAEVADCFIEDATAEQHEFAKRLFTDKKIDLLTPLHKIEIPMSNAVDCIRLEPFYFVKDLKTEFK